MLKLAKCLEHKAKQINEEMDGIEKVREWIGERDTGKIISFMTPEEAYHMVFTMDSVVVRKGEYPSCEVWYHGTEVAILDLLDGKTTAYSGSKEGQLLVWGNLNDAKSFESIL